MKCRSTERSQIYVLCSPLRPIGRLLYRSVELCEEKPWEFHIRTARASIQNILGECYWDDRDEGHPGTVQALFYLVGSPEGQEQIQRIRDWITLPQWINYFTKPLSAFVLTFLPPSSLLFFFPSYELFLHAFVLSFCPNSRTTKASNFSLC